MCEEELTGHPFLEILQLSSCNGMSVYTSTNLETLKYLTQEQMAHFIPNTKGQTFPAEPLEPVEVLGLIQSCSGTSTSGLRDAALIAVMWRGGLRVGEALALLPRDLDAENGTIRVRHGKGDKARLVGLDNTAWLYLQKWMARRESIGANGRHPVFCLISKGKIGLPMSYWGVNDKLKKLAKKAGIEKRVHPHGLRHSLAVGLQREGKRLDEIQGALGHAQSSTTDKYLHGLNPMEVVDAMRDRQWPEEA